MLDSSLHLVCDWVSAFRILTGIWHRSFVSWCWGYLGRGNQGGPALLRGASDMQCSLMLKEGIRGSDLPFIEPRHIAGYNFPLVRFLILAREILGYGDLQHLIHIWGRVLI